MSLITKTADFFRKKETFAGEEFLFKLLRDDQDNYEIGIDASTGEKFFKYTVPEGKCVWLERVNFTVLNPLITPDTFFGIDPLANGVSFGVLNKDQAQVLDYSDSVPLKVGADFASLAGSDVVRENATGRNVDATAIRWTLSKAGYPLFLDQGQSFYMRINDDLSGIVRLRAMVQGVIVNRF